MIFDNSLDINKELLIKYTEFWDAIKYKIKKINGGEETDYRKYYIKIKSESDDDLPLKEPLIFYEMHIFVGFVFKEHDKFLKKMMKMRHSTEPRFRNTLKDMSFCYLQENLVINMVKN